VKKTAFIEVDYKSNDMLRYALTRVLPLLQSEVQGRVMRDATIRVSSGRAIRPPVRIEVNLGAVCVVVQSKMNYGVDSTLKNDLYENPTKP
jgi:hypothetical protein